MKTWIRGGLWGLGIGIIAFFLPFAVLFAFDTKSNIMLNKILLFISSPVCSSLPSAWKSEGGGTFCWMSIGWITTLAIAFLIGSIVGRIKSKDKKI